MNRETINQINLLPIILYKFTSKYQALVLNMSINNRYSVIDIFITTTNRDGATHKSPLHSSQEHSYCTIFLLKTFQLLQFLGYIYIFYIWINQFDAVVIFKICYKEFNAYYMH